MSRSRVVPFMMALAFLAGLFSPWRPPAMTGSAQAEGRYFPETGHWLRGRFLQYWNDHGGLAQQGYPLSEEFTEVSKLDNIAYTVQYFERAVFEYHPEKAAPYDVLLAQLGNYELYSRYQPESHPAMVPQPGPGAATPPFYEDRSDPVTMLQSYYNAVNRKEYPRAYSYLESPERPYNQFAQGYADTRSVALQTGTVQGQGAAGSTYADIPTVLVATHTNGSTERFYGCYTARRTNFPVEGDPAAGLYRVYRGQLQAAPPNTPAATLLAQACP